METHHFFSNGNSGKQMLVGTPTTGEFLQTAVKRFNWSNHMAGLQFLLADSNPAMVSFTTKKRVKYQKRQQFDDSINNDM
jgi:hypothetical protein